MVYLTKNIGFISLDIMIAIWFPLACLHALCMSSAVYALNNFLDVWITFCFSNYFSGLHVGTG